MNNFYGSDYALYNSLYGNYRNRKFTDIWGNVNAFLQDYRNNGMPVSITNTSATTLYYLLYSRYGNSTIASSDENQFKYKVFSLIFSYGPTWEKRLEIQKKLREMSEDDLRESAKAIYNHSFNPSTDPGTDTDKELETINDQNVTKHRRSKTDAYALLMSLLETDVTTEFVDRFKKLFLTVVEPELPLWYVTDLDYVDDEPTPTPTPTPEPEPEPIEPSTDYYIGPNTTVYNVSVSNIQSQAVPTKINFANMSAGQYSLKLTSGTPLALRDYYTITMSNGITFSLESSNGFTYQFEYTNQSYFNIISNGVESASRIVNLGLTKIS